MALENKPGITDFVQLDRTEEKISQKYIEMNAAHSFWKGNEHPIKALELKYLY